MSYETENSSMMPMDSGQQRSPLEEERMRRMMAEMLMNKGSANNGMQGRVVQQQSMIPQLAQGAMSAMAMY